MFLLRWKEGGHFRFLAKVFIPFGRNLVRDITEEFARKHALVYVPSLEEEQKFPKGAISKYPAKILHWGYVVLPDFPIVDKFLGFQFNEVHKETVFDEEILEEYNKISCKIVDNKTVNNYRKV